MNTKYSCSTHSRSSYDHLRLHAPPAAVLSPRANSAAPLRHSRRQEMLCEFPAASLAITLQLITGTLTVAVGVQRGRIQTSTKANQVWIVLPSVALSQAAC